MGKRTFDVEFTVTATIELDDAVIDAVDDEWRKYAYNLKTVEEIVGHIVYNMIANRAELSQLDGWADQSDKNALLTGEDWGKAEVWEDKPL